MTKDRFFLLLSGICLVLMGIWAFAYPAQTLLFFVGLIGAVVLVSGVCYLLAFFFASDRFPGGRGWLLVRGLVDVLLGVLLLWKIGITVAVLPWIFGLWGIFSGGLYLSQDLSMKSAGGSAWWLMLLSGILSIVIGILFIANPLVGLFVITFQVGFFLLLFGIAAVMAAFSARQ